MSELHVVMGGKHRHNSGNCERCGVWRRSLHRDHIVPKCKGGVDDPSNIQNLCANCHEDKTVIDLTGMPLSLAARQKQSRAQAGKTISPQRRAAIIESHALAEVKEKCGAAARESWKDPEVAAARVSGTRRWRESMTPGERQALLDKMHAGMRTPEALARRSANTSAQWAKLDVGQRSARVANWSNAGSEASTKEARARRAGEK